MQSRVSLRWYGGLTLLLVVATLLGLTLGKFPLSIHEVVQSLWTKGAEQTAADVVVWNLRLPRLVAAIMVGAALAAAGATYQAMFRNPLVICQNTILCT